MAAKVGPLGELRLAEDDRTLRTEERDDVRLAAWLRLHQRKRARRRAHQVAGVDIVLDEHRHTMQRASRASRRALGVQLIGRGERVWVDLEHGAQARPRLIDAVDPSNAVRTQAAGGGPSGG